MPRPKKAMPAYRFHISGQAVVTLGGKDFYLGPHDSPESRVKYLTLVGEYQRNGLRAPDQPTHQMDLAITVSGVTTEFRATKLKSFDRNPAHKCRFENLCKLLDDEYGDTPAKDFGPRKLADLRELLVVDGNCRKYVNSQIRFIVRIFKHALSRELIEPGQLVALESLESLKKGEAKDNPPRKPASLELIHKTLPHLCDDSAAMVRIQLATGCRPSELFTLTPAEVDQSGEVWMIRKTSHKTAHHGKQKVIPIVGDARDAIAPFLLGPENEVCFTNASGTPWNRNTYRRRITRQCETLKIDRWTPYQIRHLVGQSVRDKLSAEHVQAILGHSRISMVETYSRASEHKAVEAAIAIQAAK
ncbi:MAG: tyrosine-type recombinase/integrase [Planctomycetales bacterium]|nr:tyrosine-type recombinase/integrase [Planctomycetales bacterium]